jgi:hypothetical protein
MAKQYQRGILNRGLLRIPKTSAVRFSKMKVDAKINPHA